MAQRALRLGFAGTPRFSVPALEALADSEHAVQVVFTKPDRAAGRGRHLQVSPVKQRALELGLDCVVEVRDEEQLELVLEELDPEILLLTGDESESALSLLPDVPAGKLAIADGRGASSGEIAELERAGVDAVLVGDAPPEA